MLSTLHQVLLLQQVLAEQLGSLQDQPDNPLQGGLPAALLWHSSRGPSTLELVVVQYKTGPVLNTNYKNSIIPTKMLGNGGL